MKIGKQGIELIKSYEQLRLTAYRAVPTEKHLTIGWGHYGPDVKAGQTISPATADRLFRRDLEWVEKEVNAVGPLKQQQFDAVCSLVYNIGASNFRKSGLRSRLVAGKPLDAAMEFIKWRKSGGKVLKGLMRRRSRETTLFLEA
jgi:GH24 family phage-related lysozyme (muramidase)